MLLLHLKLWCVNLPATIPSLQNQPATMVFCHHQTWLWPPYIDGVAGTPYVMVRQFSGWRHSYYYYRRWIPTTPGAHNTFHSDVILPTPLYNLTNSLNNASYMAASYQGSPVVEGFLHPRILRRDGPWWTTIRDLHGFRNTSTGGL